MMHGEVPHHQAPQEPPSGYPQRGRSRDFQAMVHHMRLPLSPLVRLDTGAIHPSFPTTVLRYWLLTDEQCEELAHFYHQRSPGPWSAYYPCPVVWDSRLSLEEKRRKIGKFIGMQNCDSPIQLKTEDEIAEDARRARIAEEEAIMRGKLGPWR